MNSGLFTSNETKVMEERNFEVASIFSCSNIFLNMSLFRARQFSENVLRRRHEMKGTVSEDEKRVYA